MRKSPLINYITGFAALRVGPEETIIEGENRMTTTYRAVYIPPKPGDNGVGIVLTGPEHSQNSDDILYARRAHEAEAAGLQVSPEEIIIGEWTA